MLSHRPAHVAALTALASLGLCLTGPTRLGAQTPVPLVLSNATVTLAATCTLSAPLAVLHVLARNAGALPAAAQSFAVFDEPHALGATGTTVSLLPSATQTLDIPLVLDTRSIPTAPLGAAGLPGHHTLTVFVGTPQLGRTAPAATVSLDIPATFCGTPRSVAGAAHTSASVGTVPATIATPKPTGVSLPATLQGPVAKLLEISPPRLLHAVSGSGDCAGHWATPHAFSTDCGNMIGAGDLVLIWDAPSVAPANGYRLYAVDGNGAGTEVVQTIADAKETLADIPHLASGFNGKCYALTAVSENRESERTYRYCAGSGAVASRTTLAGQYLRSFQRNQKHDGASALFISEAFGTSDRVAGHLYAESKALLGDSYNNEIRRFGVAFDLTPFVRKRLVSAKLRLTIASSVGAGNNHSCADQVGTGGEFWWKSDAAGWPNTATFSAGIGNTGPEVSSDVTDIVRPWFGGAPNYGFILRNSYENLGLFTNDVCETSYGNAQLDLVYY